MENLLSLVLAVVAVSGAGAGAGAGAGSSSGDSAPHIIVLLTDDQDVRLGSMRAMPYTESAFKADAINMTNFFVNTAICCPSRSTLLSGRMNHNNKASRFDSARSRGRRPGRAMECSSSTRVW